MGIGRIIYTGLLGLLGAATVFVIGDATLNFAFPNSPVYRDYKDANRPEIVSEKVYMDRIIPGLEFDVLYGIKKGNEVVYLPKSKVYPGNTDNSVPYMPVVPRQNDIPGVPYLIPTSSSE